MRKLFSLFHRDDSGAVTADWVVLSALAVTLLAAGYGQIESGTTDLSGDTETYLANYTH